MDGTTTIKIDYYEELKAKADKWDEKETPYKPNNKTFTSCGYCKCSSYVTKQVDRNYCSECGQKLDWESEGE